MPPFKHLIDVLVGTYTHKNNLKGIYRYSFHPETGEIIRLSAIDAPNASYLARYNDRLVAVHEHSDEGKVSLYAVTQDDMVLLDSVSSYGGHPCHISWSADGSLIFVSNYTGGSLQIYRLSSDKKSLIFKKRFEYRGFGPHIRQQSPHIHAAVLTPCGKLYVSDLGNDRVYIYAADKQADAFHLIDYIETFAGGGPRHLAFGPAPSRTVYILLELTGQLTVYKYNGAQWLLQQVLAISDDEFIGEHGGSHIMTSPDGRFIYATNRGDANVIACYKIEEDGLLTLLEVSPTGGIGPRNFNITPDGQYLLIANQQSDEIAIFQRNINTGTLSDTGKRIRVPSPACIIF